MDIFFKGNLKLSIEIYCFLLGSFGKLQGKVEQASSIIEGKSQLGHLEFKLNGGEGVSRVGVGKLSQTLDDCNRDKME